MVVASGRFNEEQTLSVNSQIWGFFSGRLTGTADVIFRRADWLNGIDAWRIMARQVDHGRTIRLETLRREVREIHSKLIKCVEHVEEGVAAFENTMQQFVRAGGPESSDSELKTDLCRILLREIRELLLWHSTDVGVTFQHFRDTVVSQTAQILMMRGGARPINAVDGRQTTTDDDHNDAYTAEEHAAWEHNF